jgi:hypothetical protein
MSTYEKDLNSLKHLIASTGNFNDYVDSLNPMKKREFVNDVEYIIGRTKSKYKNVLKFHLFIFTLFLVSIINLKFNFSGLSIILFTSAFGVLFVASQELYKNWKTVRKYKLIKKAIKTKWLGESELEDDDSEFFTKGKEAFIK